MLSYKSIIEYSFANFTLFSFYLPNPVYELTTSKNKNKCFFISFSRIINILDLLFDL